MSRKRDASTAPIIEELRSALTSWLDRELAVDDCRFWLHNLTDEEVLGAMWRDGFILRAGLDQQKRLAYLREVRSTMGEICDEWLSDE